MEQQLQHIIYRGDFRILSLSSPQPNIQTDIQHAFFSHTQITCIYTNNLYINMYQWLALRTESMIMATDRSSIYAPKAPPMKCLRPPHRRLSSSEAEFLLAKLEHVLLVDEREQLILTH